MDSAASNNQGSAAESANQVEASWTARRRTSAWKVFSHAVRHCPRPSASSSAPTGPGLPRGT
ncbi:hypothetical protein, partial [Yinghuangia sp. YIM S10712]|uniref:hypothetical protein n=1 Tax=Yinghuangia sp. YIM S10712 TaxID=3436930 RepID=UPI003F53A5E9